MHGCSLKSNRSPNLAPGGFCCPICDGWYYVAKHGKHMWNRRKRRREKLALQDEVDEVLAEAEWKITHKVGQVLIAEVCDPDMPELERPHDIVLYTSYEPLVCIGVDQYGSGTYTWLKQDRRPNTIVAKHPDLTLIFVPDSPESTCELAIIVQIIDRSEL